jgi:chromosomal replication initiation ATPase DnaA
VSRYTIGQPPAYAGIKEIVMLIHLDRALITAAEQYGTTIHAIQSTTRQQRVVDARRAMFERVRRDTPPC